MAIHKVGVLSDTHNRLRDEVSAKLSGCEAILHAGDIANEKIIESLKEIAPLYAVRGNADSRISLPLEEVLSFELFGFSFLMVHNKKQLPANASDKQFVVYGHSHKVDIHTEAGTTYLNPGSCGPRRIGQPVTMLLLFLDDEKKSYELKLYDFAQKSAPGISANEGEDDEVLPSDEEMQKLKQMDMDLLITKIVGDMQANKSCELIAATNHVSIAFVKQILQIYTTHPGIDVYGIMNRLDIWGK